MVGFRHFENHLLNYNLIQHYFYSNNGGTNFC